MDEPEPGTGNRNRFLLELPVPIRTGNRHPAGSPARFRTGNCEFKLSRLSQRLMNQWSNVYYKARKGLFSRDISVLRAAKDADAVLWWKT